VRKIRSAVIAFNLLAACGGRSPEPAAGQSWLFAARTNADTANQQLVGRPFDDVASCASAK
jgi:hypothetical protein